MTAPRDTFADLVAFVVIVFVMVAMTSAAAPRYGGLSLDDCADLCAPRAVVVFERDRACYCDNFTEEAE